VHQQEIVFKTKNNNYDKIIKSMDKKNIEHIGIHKSQASVRTKNIEKGLKQILEGIKSNNDKLKDIRIIGASLDDVFINLVKSEKAKKKRKDKESKKDETV